MKITPFKIFEEPDQVGGPIKVYDGAHRASVTDIPSNVAFKFVDPVA